MSDGHLNLLLKQIQLSNDYHHYFEGGKLTNLDVDKERRLWTFNVELKQILPIDVYKEFDVKIKEAFDFEHIDNVYFRLVTQEVNYKEEDLIDYWPFVISLLPASSPMI